MTDWLNRTHLGDCRDLMRQMIAAGIKVQCIVTSPPYWGLRDYGTGSWEGGDADCDHLQKTGGTAASTLGAASGGNDMSDEARARSTERSFVEFPALCGKCGARRVDKQFGLERTWIRHVARMRGVFRLARELLADDGVLWMNYGDSYAGAPGGWQGKNGQRSSRTFTARIDLPKRGNGLKPKDLVGMPWRVAFALQHDGWYLRSDVIWHKPNPMPESIKDRPTKSHEYVFLFAKSSEYHYDADAIAEPTSKETHARAARGRSENHKWADGGPGDQTIAKVNPFAGHVAGVNPKAHRVPTGWVTGSGDHRSLRGRHQPKQNSSFSAAVIEPVLVRNVRTVWTIPTEGFSGAHFATFPQDLVARCILAGSRPGDTILDIFHGSGTVGKVATDLGRNFIGLELNPEYIELNELRRTTQGMPI